MHLKNLVPDITKMIHRTTLAVTLIASMSLSSQSLAQDATSAPKSKSWSALAGYVIDSIHMGPLAGATVLVDGTVLSATTDDKGAFRIDSIEPGDYRLAVFHPLLDTLGVAVATESLRLGADSVRDVILSTPSSQSIVQNACSPARLRLGSGAVMGQVLDPDTGAPMDSVRVTLLWTTMEIGKDVGVRRRETVREAYTDKAGNYLICGVPPDAAGSLQAERDDAKTAEVPVDFPEGSLLAFRSVRLSTRVAAGPDNLLTGAAQLTGKVVTDQGIPVPDAQVSVVGAKPVANTSQDGEFVLNDLPSGTRTAIVRRIGYSPTEMPVELTAEYPARISVRLTKSTTRLDEVRVEGVYETALKKNGFTDRKRMGMGRYLTPKDIERRNPRDFSSLFHTMSGFRVESDSYGRQSIKGTRGGDGCVVFWVDGIQMRNMASGDMDDMFSVDQLMAIETYTPSTVPGEFRATTQSSCSTIVVWTNRTVKR